MPDSNHPAGLDIQIASSVNRRLLEALAGKSQALLVKAFEEADIEFLRFKSRPDDYLDIDLVHLLHILNQPKYFPGIVIEFGMLREVLDLGVLGFTVLSCRDIRQAMKVIARYHSLTAVAYEMVMSEEGERTYSRQWVKPGHMAHRVEIDEEHLTGIWRLLRSLLPESMTMEEVVVQLGFAEPDYADLYRDKFNCHLEFGGKSTFISYPSEWLDLPIQSADAAVEQACQAQCETLLQRLGGDSVVVDDVRRIILSVPAHRSVKLEEVAATMMLSVRSLERRLLEAGTSFRAIDNEIRMGLASEYMGLEYLSNKEIAYLLNYSQPSTFYRAFKNWYGMTPKEYRLKNISR